MVYVMNSRIDYRINYEKAIETIVWLASEKPGIDIYHLGKVLFYADKKHINRYGRPILGDTYIRMEYGPIPSGVKDLISKNLWLSPDHIESVNNAIEIKNTPHPSIFTSRPPNMDFFSETDIECLKESLFKYGDKSFELLKKKTHNERCWLETSPNQPLDYALFVDEDNPNRDEILKEMSETAAYLQV